MSASSGEKTEAPTPKKRRDAADKGDVLQSRDLGTALACVAGLGWLIICGHAFTTASMASLDAGLRESASAPALKLVAAVLSPYAWPLAALAAAMTLAALAVPALLGTFGWRTSALRFDARKLSPIAGLKRMFGVEALIELAKTLVKTALLVTVGLAAVIGSLAALLALGDMPVATVSARAGALALQLTTLLVVILVIVGAADALIQHRRRLGRLRMTRQEVLDEMKEQDGSPESRAHARARRHALLRASVRRGVGEAAVVLTNPTHFAVALRYRHGTDAAPIVTARGKDELAAAIRALAADHDVPVIECPDLARAIYFTSRAGQVVKSDLFAAIATVLAFVYRLDRSLDLPAIDVPATARFDETGRRTG
jgi:flagellar biosynthesis protein FlhB